MKTKPSITGVEIGNIVFELDESCAALKLTEDEHKFAVAAVVAAWEAQQEYLLFLSDTLLIKTPLLFYL